MTEPNEASRQAKAHELSLLRSLTSASARKLRSHWIETVEQFAAAAATEQGREGLKSLLAETQVPVHVLLQEACEIVGARQFEALMQAKPGGPLGARFDDPKGGLS